MKGNGNVTNVTAANVTHNLFTFGKYESLSISSQKNIKHLFIHNRM